MNTDDLRRQLEDCLARFRRRELREADLLAALALLETPRRQQLLYLQTSGTGLDSGVIGISLIAEGQIQELPLDPAQWPYQNVLAALADGWRVIKFPELALLLQEEHTVGLGCEFVLEK